ncbi:MAG: hypothetical protein WBB07_17685 [Mycobacterium sp.]
MKIREYAKAIAALLGAIATFLVSVNAPAEWSVWIGSVVAILTGVATFGIPNKTIIPAAADAAITAMQQTAERAAGSLSDYDRVRQAASDILGSAASIGAAVIPGRVGDLIQGVSDFDGRD